MIDRNTRESDDRLPPELRKLHDELSSIDIEERASFGPELRAELERIWAEEPEEPETTRRWKAPALLAALLGGLILVSMAAPQARAGMVRLLDVLQREVETLLEEPEDPGVPEVVMDRTDPESEGPPATGAPERGLAGSSPGPEAVPSGRVGDHAFPDIADRQLAQTVIEVFYPDSLQSQGVGGTVGLTLHVTAEGRVDDIRLLESSGLEALDQAALDAASLLEFRPAIRAGEPTPIWVRFGVQFRPPPRTPGPAVDVQGAAGEVPPRR